MIFISSRSRVVKRGRGGRWQETAVNRYVLYLESGLYCPADD